MEDRALCLPGELWKAYSCLDERNLKIGFFRVNKALCWVIYSRMWKQIQEGSTPNSTLPWWDKGRRALASQPEVLPRWSGSFLLISVLPHIPLDPGEPLLLWSWSVPRSSILSLTSAQVSLARGETRLGGAGIHYRLPRKEREEDWAPGMLQNMNQAQIISQQFTWVFCDCLHCCLFIYFLKSVLILATTATCSWHENTEHLHETHGRPVSVQSPVLPPNPLSLLKSQQGNHSTRDNVGPWGKGTEAPTRSPCLQFP